MSVLKRATHLLFALSTLGLFTLHSGCSTNASLAVSAINNPSVEARQTFVLVNGNTDEPDDGLRFQEMAEIIKLELATRGMYGAPSYSAADLIVRVETRVELVYRSIEVLAVTYSSPSGRYDSEVALIVSDTKKTISVPYYKTVLALTAEQNPTAPGTDPTLVWKVEASTESEQIDLRKVLPGLASAAADYIGEETGDVLKVSANSQATVQHIPNRSRLLSR